MAKKTKFLRIAVEGATTDGRVIERSWIEQMAAAYNPATYTARINCEHVHGYSPLPPFNAYGSVLALKAEEFDIEIDGKTERRLALLAQLEANDQLVEMVKSDQKIFTSCEIAPNFAGTGKAGLVGLAITDNPASLGTEVLSFAAFKPLLTALKADPSNLFSAAAEAAIELDDTPAQTLETGLVAAIKAIFSTAPAAPAVPAAPALPAQPAPANDNLAAIADQLGVTFSAALTAHAARTDAAILALSGEMKALTTKLEKAEAPGFRRQPAAGGTGEVATDC
ncbi:GPO family capsid scaffolding protein [Govanella unica]|uniref:GPO family capsid scaffolding protein n=1 Tax=Govanella unica TaxID=2975056 RepID=A0A9X3Z685_9PROT|nr:GPO family capsid scaffolding protein [Govania unica]MDA5192812.1 GPO family capsid scaffolding protein [Govania unica]